MKVIIILVVLAVAHSVASQEPVWPPVRPTKPPATELPATEPPTTKPPPTKPPATQPPTTKPPATKPPATQPSTTKPPPTQPPTTKPSATKPPTTKPPATKPPSTKPPPTRPPVRCWINPDPEDDGILLANPLDCGSYYACVGLEPVLMECPDELEWNDKQKICDWPELANCTVSAQ